MDRKKVLILSLLLILMLNLVACTPEPFSELEFQEFKIDYLNAFDYTKDLLLERVLERKFSEKKLSKDKYFEEYIKELDNILKDVEKILPDDATEFKKDGIKVIGDAVDAMSKIDKENNRSGRLIKEKKYEEYMNKIKVARQVLGTW